VYSTLKKASKLDDNLSSRRFLLPTHLSNNNISAEPATTYPFLIVHQSCLEKKALIALLFLHFFVTESLIREKSRPGSTPINTCTPSHHHHRFFLHQLLLLRLLPLPLLL
jgi:hypothetical protein